MISISISIITFPAFFFHVASFVFLPLLNAFSLKENDSVSLHSSWCSADYTDLNVCLRVIRSKSGFAPFL